MRLNRYIIEAEDSQTVINDTIALLRKDCGPFLKDLSKAERGKFVYRGIKRALRTDSDTLVEKFKPRKDRWPTDIPQEIHEYINKELKAKFGWFPRTEGVFASSSFMIAADFGIPMLFFPIGKYKYVFAPKVRDFLTALDSESVVHYSGGKWTVDRSYDRETREDRIDDILDGYTNKNLEKAITNGAELIFNCKGYYLIDASVLKGGRFDFEEEIWK